MSQQEYLVSWLKDAHGLEENLIRVLERRIEDINLPEDLRAKQRYHLERTRNHADLVRMRLESLGERPSTFKDAMGAVSGVFSSVGGRLASDSAVKNCLADYSMENMEIASYTSLMAAAREIGDEQTVEMCQAILHDEQEMAQILHDYIPIVTQQFLMQEQRA